MSCTHDLRKYIHNAGIVSSIDVEKFAVNCGQMSAESARRAVRRMVQRGELMAISHDDQIKMGLTDILKTPIARYSII